jgi:membrane-bound lytic murein transglycosylase F
VHEEKSDMKKSFLNILVVPLIILSGCGKGKNEAKPVFQGTPRTLEEIRKCGELRVLTTPSPGFQGLPRKLTPQQSEQALLEKLADKLNVKLKIIRIKDIENLIPYLLAGRGDIIAANMTATRERKQKIKFTIPLVTTKEQIVCRALDKRIKRKADLAGKTVMIEDGTCYRKNLERLKREIPSLKIQSAPDGMDTQEILEKVAGGKFEAVISDSNYVDVIQSYRPGIRVVYEFPEDRHIAWGIRPDNIKLLKVLDAFLKTQLPRYRMGSMKGDLPEIKERKILRVLTRDNPFNYFIHRGELMGFEYELAKKFAKENDLQLIMVVPPAWNDLIPWLITGKGDIIASSLTITDERRKIKDISFCHPYIDNREYVVTRKNDSKLKSLKDLKGRTIAVRKNSSYWQTLSNLMKKGASFKLITAPDNMETNEIIEWVADGKYDLTIADEHYLKGKISQGVNVRAAFPVGTSNHYGWVVRKDDTRLRNAIDKFFKKEYKGRFYNIIYHRYYENHGKLKKHDQVIKDSNEKFCICRFDDIFRKYGEKYGFHWCLVASQVYQESRFDPKVKAWDGGMGLMQLMPATAKELGCKNPFNPADNVHAGTKYMNQLRKRCGYQKKEVSPKDSLCFALASYNGGYGHLKDARALAEDLKLDPNKWFDNVEKSMKLLSKRKYSSRARYGYCNSKVITDYVREIMLRYTQYARHLEHLDRKKNSRKNLPK